MRALELIAVLLAAPGALVALAKLRSRRRPPRRRRRSPGPRRPSLRRQAELDIRLRVRLSRGDGSRQPGTGGAGAGGTEAGRAEAERAGAGRAGARRDRARPEPGTDVAQPPAWDTPAQLDRRAARRPASRHRSPASGGQRT
ncbi:MAG TPA: hypothetical protein VL988_03600 [Solirubrobacteraceae bacterium]|nr:hypothetical protein [Solirubrobacteraceae bacterium]